MHDLQHCVKLDAEGVFEAPLPRLIVVWFEIHQYLTDSIVQSSCSKAVLTFQKCLDFSHGLSGQFDFAIIEPICRTSGLKNKGKIH